MTRFRYFPRAWQLWRSNPRLFYRRLGLFVRHPLRSLDALRQMRRRNAAVDRAYRAWLGAAAHSASPDAPSGTTPLLSVILPVHDPPEAILAAALDSVVAQSYPHWELCVADDASTRPYVRVMLEQYAARDARVRVVYRPESGHIAAASNSALALARGEFVVLLDHDDLLAPEALGAIAAVVATEPLVDLVYSDEDKLDPAGRRVTPFFKPAWSPTLLLSWNYITHLAAVRRALVQAVGGFRTATVGSQDHDLFLRASERARAVAHIPRILYSWRMARGSTATASSAKPYAVTAARRALADAVERRGLDATLKPSHLNGLFVAHLRPPSDAAVSLVVRGAGDAWRTCLRQPGFVVRDMVWLPGDDETTPLSRPGDPPLVTAIDALTGDYLVWLDARERPALGAIAALLAQARTDGIGFVGGVTLRRGVILQAGVIVGSGGQPRHAYADLPALPQFDNVYLHLKDLAREVSAVAPGGCALRREVWRQLDGWRADLPPALALTDLCLRALERGYSNLFTPLARFSRATPLPPFPSVADYAWPWHGYDDPFWNPNLDPDHADGLPFRNPGGRQARVRYRGPRGAFVAILPPGERADLLDSPARSERSTAWEGGGT